MDAETIEFQAPRSLVDTIVEGLEREIMVGALPTGARLSEKSLAEKFGVSRGPLREALRRLEGRGLIVRTHNLGARVASPTEGDLSQLLLVREALEGVAARIAAETMALEDIADLQDLTEERHQTRPEDASFHQTPDNDFHSRIILASHNERLINLLNGDAFYMLRIYRFRSSVLPGRHSQAIAEHRVILAAMAARDPDGAEGAMRRHLRNAHANILENFQLSIAARGPIQMDGYADRRSTAQKAIQK